MRKIAKWRREKMEKMRSFDLGFQKKSKQIGNHAEPYIKGKNRGVFKCRNYHKKMDYLRMSIKN